LYKRIVRLSEKLYNQGIERLKASDFTHGIESLTRSISINKSNIAARNLLGLALFEVGHIGDALTHWVISNSIQEEGNPAEGYLERANKNSRVLEKLNDSITMYNVALNHIKSKSDDLAVIQLKRAVENNPRFIDALNLLVLCYLIQNEQEKAASTVERVLAMDVRNPVALGYYSVLNPGSKGKALRPTVSATKFVQVSNNNKGTYKSVNIPDKKSTNFHIAEVLSFVIGVGCAIAIIYFLLYPAFVSDHESQIASVNRQIVEAEETHEEQIQALADEKDNLHLIINARDNTINSLEQTIELQNRINQVHLADWLYRDDQLREAIDILEYLDTSGMAFDIRGRIDAIREGAYPRLAAGYFTEGQRYHNASDFYKSLGYLQMSLRFSEDTSPHWRDLLYFLGTAYYRTGSLNEAYELLTTLRENFPNHRPINTGNMIRSIENRT